MSKKHPPVRSIVGVTKNKIMSILVSILPFVGLYLVSFFVKSGLYFGLYRDQKQTETKLDNTAQVLQGPPKTPRDLSKALWVPP